MFALDMKRGGYVQGMKGVVCREVLNSPAAMIRNATMEAKVFLQTTVKYPMQNPYASQCKTARKTGRL